MAIENQEMAADVSLRLQVHSDEGVVEEYPLNKYSLEQIEADAAKYDAAQYVVTLESIDAEEIFRHPIDAVDHAVPYEVAEALWSEYQEAEQQKSALSQKNAELYQDVQTLEDELEQQRERVAELEKTTEKDDVPEEVVDEIVDEYRLGKGDLAGITFDSIGGLDEELDEFREHIEVDAQYPQITENLADLNLRDRSNGVLLYGPPGTGKTMAAKAFANEYDFSIFLVNGPEIMDSYVGKSEEAVRDLYKTAKAMDPSLIVFDELDAIARNRGSGSTNVGDRVVGQMLTLMDGFDEDAEIYWVGTTNRREMIDDALLRPGRFDTQIPFDRPNIENTQEIAACYLPDEYADRVADIVATNETYLDVNSGSVIKQVAAQAATEFLRSGDVFDTVADRELQRYDEDDPGIFDLRDATFNLTEPEQKREIVANYAGTHLFTDQDHFTIIDPETVERAAHTVYQRQITEESADDTGGRIGFQ